MRSRIGSILCVFGLLVAIAGCRGHDDNGAAPPPSSNNPPPPPPPPVVGAAGGTVTETSGASVIVPAGAFASDTTVRIARDSTGAPAIPADLHSAGSTYVITPHGGDFAEGVEVRLPVPNVTLTPYQEFKIAKAEPGEPWIVLEDTVVDQNALSVKVDSFSYFTAVVVTYLLPIAQAEPLRFTTSLACTDNRCSGLIGATTAAFTVTSNNGQAPADCINPFYGIGTGGGGGISWPSQGSSIGVAPITTTGGSMTRTLNPASSLTFKFAVGRKCGVNGRYSDFGYTNSKIVTWAPSPGPNLSILRMPEQVDVVEGLVANVDVVMSGGAAIPTDTVSYTMTSFSVPTRTNRAIIDWERSDDNGGSWRVVAHSYQDEADKLPGGVGYDWRYWGIRHGFVATAADQGALLRFHACYTPPAPAMAPPCVHSVTARINVLQQSALPTIVDAPRSILVRTGQTANLSATAAGLPAPTLQWQTRPANSNDAWSNVTTGTGPTTANYTTAAVALSDNGTQYRIVATNAVGSAASTAVTVSVSDFDVAPTIATQPSSLSVASGSDAVFAVDARGTEALSYQWYRNSVALAGANSPVLRLSSVNMLNSGSFTVSVSNAAGSVTSNAAILNVYPGTPAAVAPTIVTQPASLTVNAGNTATFAVGVDGSGPFTFQWRRNGLNIPGATSAVLTLPNVVSDASGEYSVVVSNAASPGGVTSSSASLSVSASGVAIAPTIVTQPATLIVPFRGSGVIAVGATGSGPLTYQWSRNGEELTGATSPVLNFGIVADVDVGIYTVAVSNSLGTVVSQGASIILLGAPVITLQPVSVTALEGEIATFFVSASSSGLRYQWSVNGNPIPGAIGNTWNAGPVVTANSGAVYSVLVYNGAGLVFSQGAVLTVQTVAAPSINQHPQSVTVQPGQQAEMCVTIGGTPPFDVLLQRWNGVAWVSGAGMLLNSNTNACYFTDVLALADNGAQFRFLVENPAGQNVSNTATVTVVAPSVITTTLLASRSTSGATANNRSGTPSLSADGNLIAFTSDGTNLVPNFNGDAFSAQYAYVRNLSTGVTTLINQKPDGSRSMYGVLGLKLAAGGRYAIFSSMADDLVADDTNGSQDVFVRDLQTGTTRRVSLRADGTESPPSGGGQSNMQVNISADGRFVSFVSSLDLIGNDPPGNYSLYFRSLQTGFLKRVPTSSSSLISYSVLSDNGEHLAWRDATFVPERNWIAHYDTEADVSEEVFSIDSTNNASFLAQGVSISGDGRYIAFSLRSPTTFNGSTYTQILAIDRNNPGQITIASGDSNGVGNGHSINPVVSNDGHVLFFSNAGSLTGDFANPVSGTVVVRDLQSSALAIASRRANGTPVLSLPDYAISSDGTAVAFVGDEVDVTGSGVQGAQVFVAPRP